MKTNDIRPRPYGIATYLSEQRIENMLLDYWERFSFGCRESSDIPTGFHYWPSCPEVTAEFEL
jgi:hypothetical protein